jgi:serine/threonine protein kinase
VSTGEPRNQSKFELPLGASVGKYEILRKIATGGMAEIYLACVRGTAGFEKLVVLKRILPQLAEDPKFVQMFLDEARLASTLHHPNIADVYDVGEADGQYFFTMEFVHGHDVRTLRHEMQKRNEPLPLAVALAIIHGAASALDHAHDRRGPDGQLLGLVHRDVSASNVMVSYDGAVKLLDFGIARVRSATHTTQAGTLKGKVPYMSPEQCKGMPVDRRSDLFSLGVVLYELTVGHRPFRGDSDYAIMDQIVYHGAPPPSSAVNGYPAELEAIVMKCLERAPKARYTTGDELLEELDAFTRQAGQWISPKQVGKYMRTVFADRVKAWQEAEAAGVPFMQHVTESITSHSQQSDVQTPPSVGPALLEATANQRVNPVRGTKPMAVVARATYTPPAPLPFVAPDKASEGWDAPTSRRDSEPEFVDEAPTREASFEELAVASDPNATFHAAAPEGRDLDEAPTLQGAKVTPVKPGSRPATKSPAAGLPTSAPPAPAVAIASKPPPYTPLAASVADYRPPEPSAFAAATAGLDAPAFPDQPPVGLVIVLPEPASSTTPILRPRSHMRLVVIVCVLVIGAGLGALIALSGHDKLPPVSAGGALGSEVVAPVVPLSATATMGTMPAPPTATGSAPPSAEANSADLHPEPSTAAKPAPPSEPVKPAVHVAPKSTPVPPKQGSGGSGWDPNSPFLPAR